MGKTTIITSTVTTDDVTQLKLNYFVGWNQELMDKFQGFSDYKYFGSGDNSPDNIPVAPTIDDFNKNRLGTVFHTYLLDPASIDAFISSNSYDEDHLDPDFEIYMITSANWGTIAYFAGGDTPWTDEGIAILETGAGITAISKLVTWTLDYVMTPIFVPFIANPTLGHYEYVVLDATELDYIRGNATPPAGLTVEGDAEDHEILGSNENAYSPPFALGGGTTLVLRFGLREYHELDDPPVLNYQVIRYYLMS